MITRNLVCDEHILIIILMKLHSYVFGTLASIALVSPAIAGDGWLTDIDTALAKAKEAKKDVFVEFTGSDWCGPCIAMHKNVFSKKEFLDNAGKSHILVSIDFPKKDPELSKKNEPIGEKYAIDGYPTVILLTSDGKEYDRFYATEYPTVEKMLAQLKSSADKKGME